MHDRTAAIGIVIIAITGCGFDPSGVSVASRGIDPAGTLPPRAIADGGTSIAVCSPQMRFCDEDFLISCKEDGSGFAETRCAHGCAAAQSACHTCGPTSPQTCERGLLTVCSPQRAWDTQVCSFGCNSSGTACRLCDDRTPPFCQGKTIIRCVNGALITAPCHGVCRDGQCCEDRDGDGVTTCDGDCDDQDADVFFGQERFFTEARPNGSFDVNCDGFEELEWSTRSSCTSFGCESGWVDDIPSCGEQGTFLDCDAWAGSCRAAQSPRIQACR